MIKFKPPNFRLNKVAPPGWQVKGVPLLYVEAKYGADWKPSLKWGDLCVVRSGTDLISLPILLLLLLLFLVVVATSSKSLTFRRLKSDRDEIWQEFC